MPRIGVTGGIGSGKSTVCRVLRELGYPVFDSDRTAKELLGTDPQINQKMHEYFGDHIFSDGRIDRVKLAALIFNNDEDRQRVNSLVHPRVREEFEEFVRNSHSELVFNEAAIFFETGVWKQFDATVLVTAPMELRIERVMKRDGVSRQQVLDRMSAQWPDERKAGLADFVLVNDEKRPLLIQIEEMLVEIIGNPPG